MQDMKKSVSSIIISVCILLVVAVLSSEALVVESIKSLRFNFKEKSKIEPQITKGKGIWVNVWNYPPDLNSFMTRLKSFDIDTIYLQINRSTTPALKHPEKLDTILKAAHENNIKVIGWSYCYLHHVEADANKYLEPALYVSPEGHRLDGMAADIEENVSEAVIKKYTELIREGLQKAGVKKKYPLIAIVFSPRIKSHYPWHYIGNNWDILMPMTYWHGLKGRNDQVVRTFVEETIVKLRELTGKPDLNIHLITDGERTSPEEVRISLDVARKMRVNSGVSIYPEHLVSDKILEEIKRY
jgi:hypothetical protein